MRFIAFTSLLCVLCAAVAWAQVPQTISYQGLLTDSANVPLPDGGYDLTFRIFTADTGSVAVWTEHHQVELSGGLFHVALGDQTPLLAVLLSTDHLWLGVAIAQGAELTPRTAIISAPYALRAWRADSATLADNAAHADSASFASSSPIPAIVDTARVALNVAPHSVTGAGIADSAIQDGNIRNGTITADKFAPKQMVTSIAGYTGDIGVSGGGGITAFVYHDTINVIFGLPFTGVATGSIPIFTVSNQYVSAAVPTFIAKTSGTGLAGLFLKGTQSQTNTAAALQVENFIAGGEGLWIRNAASGNTAPVIKLHQHPSSTANFMEGYLWDGTNTATRKFHITSAGTYVAGSDFAEALPAASHGARCVPGDVVVIGPRGAVATTTVPEDARVVGVYSIRPGVLGAEKNGETRVDTNDVPVAVMGIVPTHVTATNGAIAAGDLLTTSAVPGYAMKARPIKIRGHRIFATGTILGKALGALDRGAGTINVLVAPR